MNTLLGSQPKATFSTQPTIQSAQQQDIGPIIDFLTNALTANAPAVQQVAGEARAALPGQLGYQAPQAGPAPHVDATQAFQTGVVEPVTQDFLQRTLPATAGNYGRSAGGAFGSESAQARGEASLDTSRALTEAGSKFALGAAEANQGADLTTMLANLQATNQAAQIRNQALGIAPSSAAIPTTAEQPLIADLLTALFSPTQTTNAVGTGGSTGLLQGLLQTAGTAAGAYFGGPVGAMAVSRLLQSSNSP